METPEGDIGTPGSSPFPPLDGVRHRFVQLPGLQVHVAEAGTGEPLVLLHGFPQHWWGWHKVLPALAEHFRVIVPDLRGAGWTDAPPHGYTEEQLVADTVELLDALDLDRVHLVGFDIGGILGFRLCLAHPERVRRFVFLAAPHPYTPRSLRVLVRVLLKAWRLWPRFATTLPLVGPRLVGRGRQWLPRRMMMDGATVPDLWSPEDFELYLSRLRDPSRARAAVALYRALAVRANNRAAAGAYRGTRLVTPTLGLYGAVLDDSDRDTAGHPALIRGYEPYADDFTLMHVPGSGYYLAEEQPEAVIRHVLGFLAAT
ncbi:alpha/beta fold hydrolase [Georgenia muralis]